MIRGIDHVSLRCPDRETFDKMMKLYHELLGLEIVREWPEGVMLSAGNAMLEIFASGGREYDDRGAIRHFALSVDSADAYADLLEKAGYDVFLKPYDVEFASEPVFHARVAFCHGPLGEVIEFFESK